jgi:hypothetical protein
LFNTRNVRVSVYNYTNNNCIVQRASPKVIAQGHRRLRHRHRDPTRTLRLRDSNVGQPCALMVRIARIHGTPKPWTIPSGNYHSSSVRHPSFSYLYRISALLGTSPLNICATPTSSSGTPTEKLLQELKSVDRYRQQEGILLVTFGFSELDDYDAVLSTSLFSRICQF